MKVLEHPGVFQAFLDRLAQSRDRVLVLDYDGTLAPFTVDRSAAFPYPGVPGLLAQIISGGTRVVLISGRAVREVLMLCGVHPHPEIWGSHGFQRLKTDGSYESQPLLPSQEAALLKAAQGLRQNGLEARMELKPGGVAVHWRGLEGSEVKSLKQRVLTLWNPLLGDSAPVQLQEFDGGLELRIPGIHKGKAVEAVLAESGPAAAIAYLGDDQTDEDAFRALKGKGLSVLVRRDRRESDADIWLQPPEELIGFLKKWLQACGGSS